MAKRKTKKKPSHCSKCNKVGVNKRTHRGGHK